MKALLVLLLVSVGAFGQTKTHDFGPALKDKQGRVQWCNPDELASSSNGWQQFGCAPDANGPTSKKGHWAECLQCEASLAAEQAHRNNLADALTARVLTPSEMREVLGLGYRIYVQDMQPYFEDDLRKRFQASLDVQKTLREMALAPKAKEPMHEVTENEWQATVESIRLLTKLIDIQKKQIDIIVKPKYAPPQTDPAR